MMKRLKALLLSLSMLIFSAVPSIPASADTDAIVTDGICTSVTRAAQGDEFYVYIKVPAQNSKADSVSIHVSFEEDVFEVIEWDSHTDEEYEKIGENFFRSSHGNAAADIDLTEGITMEAKVKVKEDAEPGDHSFKVEKSSLSHWDEEQNKEVDLWTAGITEAKIKVVEAGADTQNAVTGGGISVPDKTYKPGDTFEASVIIPEIPTMADSISIRVEFDEDAFDVIEWSPSQLKGDWYDDAKNSNFNGFTPLANCKGFFALSYGSKKANIDLSDGLTLKATLQVKSGAAIGDHIFTLKNYDISFADDYDSGEPKPLWIPEIYDDTVKVTEKDDLSVTGGGISLSDNDLTAGDKFDLFVNIPQLLRKADHAEINVEYNSSAFEVLSWNSGISGVSEKVDETKGILSFTYDSSTAALDFTDSEILIANMIVRSGASTDTETFELTSWSVVYTDELGVKHELWDTPEKNRTVSAKVRAISDLTVKSDGISVSSSRVSVGQTFNVNVKIPALNHAADKINIKVEFDSDAFALVTWTSHLSGVNEESGENYFSVTTGTASSILINSPITITARLKVRNGAVQERYPIRLVASTISYADDYGYTHKLWSPKNETAYVNVIGTSSDDSVYGGGIRLSDTYLNPGNEFYVYIDVPAIGEYADHAAIRVDYNYQAFELLDWDPYITGAKSTSYPGYFILSASNSSRNIDLSQSRRFTAKMKVRNTAPSGYYNFELSTGRFFYMDDNGYDTHELWSPAYKYAALTVGAGYTTTYPQVTIRDPWNVPDNWNVVTTTTTLETIRRPTDDDDDEPDKIVTEDRDTAYYPEDDEEDIDPSDDDTTRQASGNIEITLDNELDSLTAGKVVLNTYKKFFDHSVIIIIRRTAAANEAGTYALRNLGMENNESYAFDISLYDTVTGQYIHSLGDGYIEFDIPVPSTLADDLAAVRLYHTDGNYPQRIDSSIIVENGQKKIHFRADSFSPYLMTGGIKQSGGSQLVDPIDVNGGKSAGPLNPNTGIAAAIVIPAALTGCAFLVRKKTKHRKRAKVKRED